MISPNYYANFFIWRQWTVILSVKLIHDCQQNALTEIAYANGREENARDKILEHHLFQSSGW